MGAEIQNMAGDLPLGRHLAIAARLYFGVLSQKLERLDLERYYSVLMQIEKYGDTCNQQFLADSLFIDKASMVRIIDSLTESGYILKDKCDHDRRAYWVRLTEKGAMVIPEIRKAVEEVNQAVFKGFTKEESRKFKQMLNRISGNLSALPAMDVEVEYKRKSKNA